MYRWRGPNTNQRGQGQRRGIPRSGDSYAGQGYNQNNTSNGNSGAWGSGMNMSHHQQQQQTSAGYYEQHVPVNGFNTQEAIELLTRGMYNKESYFIFCVRALPSTPPIVPAIASLYSVVEPTIDILYSRITRCSRYHYKASITHVLLLHNLLTQFI